MSPNPIIPKPMRPATSPPTLRHLAEAAVRQGLCDCAKDDCTIGRVLVDGVDLLALLDRLEQATTRREVSDHAIQKWEETMHRLESVKAERDTLSATLAETQAKYRIAREVGKSLDELRKEAESALTLAREQQAELKAERDAAQGSYSACFSTIRRIREVLQLGPDESSIESVASLRADIEAAEARATTAEREREEAKRLLQKATTQASRVMQSWYDDEYEALARLGMKFEHEQDDQD